MQLSEKIVLNAVARAVSPQSIYINEELDRIHIRSIYQGGTGHPVKPSRSLAWLKKLEKKGYLIRSAGPDGYYGFTWAITEAGKAAMEAS